jgi:tetratricopeptide (TPR) repeat protein
VSQPEGGGGPPDPVVAAGTARSMADLAQVLRHLRRRDARRRGGAPLTFRALAAETGWSIGAIAEYFGGTALPPTDRFDDLIRMLGAGPAEQGALATARDRVDELRRVRPEAGPGARRGRTPHPGPRVVPRQLPPAIRHFVGRAAELDTLDRLADRASSGDPESRAGVTALISGTAGVGKTALAVRWAARAVDRFPDGQLYVNLRGFDPSGSPMTAAEAVRVFLDAWDIAGPRIPTTVDAQIALYRSLLSDRRILVVLDNAGDADQVRPLLPGCASVLTVVTSRDRLTGLVATEEAHPVILELLRPEDARALLADRVGRRRVDAEPQAVDEIVNRSAGLPLALAVVAARASTQPGFALATLAAGLRDSAGGLAALVDDDPLIDVRAVFSWSYQRLSPGAARLFRHLGTHPGPDVGVAAAASLAGARPPVVRRALAELTRTHLIVEPAPGRYALHDLLREYAAERARATDSEADRSRAVGRLLDHYVHTAYQADRLLNPERGPIELDPVRPGVEPEDLTEYTAARAWFDRELPVVLAVVNLAAAVGEHGHVWRLAWSLEKTLDGRGDWPTQVAVQSAALAAAQRVDDPTAQAGAHRFLALAQTQLGRFDLAHDHLARALELFRRAGDPLGQGHVHLNLTWVFERQGRLAEALAHSHQALELYQVAGDRDGQAGALNAIGWYHALLGEHKRALVHCRQALPLLQSVGNRRGEADTWDSLGYAHHHLGDHDQAVTCYRRSLDLFRRLDNRYFEAVILSHLGDALRAGGDPDGARRAYAEALVILDDLDHPDAEMAQARLDETDRADQSAFGSGTE